VGEASAEDLWGEIGSALATEGALRDDPGIGHGHDGRRDVLAATFALNGEIADAGFR